MIVKHGRRVELGDVILSDKSLSQNIALSFEREIKLLSHEDEMNFFTSNLASLDVNTL